MIDIENKEFVDDFSDYLRIDKNYSENTVESYMRDLKYFLTYTDKEILNITKKDIDNYILHLLPSYNASSINRIIAANPNINPNNLMIGQRIIIPFV